VRTNVRPLLLEFNGLQHCACRYLCTDVRARAHTHTHTRTHARKECCTSVMLKHLQQYIAEGDVFLHCIVPADEM